MTYDLFHQLLYVCSTQNDSSDFLEKLEDMSVQELQQHYASAQMHYQIHDSGNDISRSA